MLQCVGGALLDRRMVAFCPTPLGTIARFKALSQADLCLNDRTAVDIGKQKAIEPI